MASAGWLIVHYVFNSIIMKLSRFLCCAVFIFLAVLYCIFIVPICDHTVYGVWCFIAWILAGVLLFMVFEAIITIPEKYLEKYFADAWDVVGWVVALIICVSYENYYEDFRIENGPTIITKFHITKTVSQKRAGYASFGYFYIGSRKYKDDIKYRLRPFNKPKGKWSYIMYLLDCEEPLHYYAIDPTEKDIDKIHDFAFMEGGKLYSYHDYALRNPDLVNHYVGFNLVYKACRMQTNLEDSTVMLKFNDVLFQRNTIQVKLDDLIFIPDTFLISHSTQSTLVPDMFRLCDNEINTPSNWAKISKYGYIFHDEVYSKEDIETQCPKIKNYIDDYIKNNTWK